MPQANILLVDDRPANLLALEAVLDGLGNLVRANSGHEALRRVAQQEFAVILLDVQMEGLDGFETASRIRAREQSRRTPIIFLTAHDNNRLTAAEAYGLGAVDYLNKPFVTPIIQAKVAQFIDLFQKSKEIEQQAELLRTMERRENEARNAAILEASLDCIILMDRKGRIIEFNPAAETTFGHRRQDVLGKDMADLIIPPSLREPHRQGLARYLETGIGSILNRRLELEAMRSDGSIFPVDVSITPIQQGGSWIFMGFLRDISQRRKAENELREADRRKDVFLATLAHELRNPLAPIRNGLHLMRLAAHDPKAVEQARSMMERQLAHMIRLIDDLMDISRISRGRIELREQRVELAEIVRIALETNRPLIEDSRHNLSVDLPDGPIFVDGDVTRLAQVFSNLVNNAAKYTAEGGTIHVAVEEVEKDAVVTVVDTGIGIAAEMLPRVFDLFTQGDHTLERSLGGLGIGLSLVQRLVELHGGSVEAHSQGHGMGSEFVVRLPISQTDPVPSESLPVHLTSAPVARRILVVDDNKDAAISLAMLLRKMGNETEVAHDGLEAIDKAEVFRPEVILLDIGMPKLNGYDACRRIRQQPWAKKVKIVALTGWGQKADREKSHDAGFDEHLVKPVDLARLEELLRQTC